MRSSPVLKLRGVWISRPMAEIIDEHLALACLGLQPRPRPRRPRISSITEHVARRTESLRVGSTGISGQDLVRVLAIARMNALLIRVGLGERHKKRALV